MFKSKSRSYFLCRLCKRFQCTNRLCHSCPSSRWVKLWNLMDEVRLTFFRVAHFQCSRMNLLVVLSIHSVGKIEIWNETFLECFITKVLMDHWILFHHTFPNAFSFLDDSFQQKKVHLVTLVIWHWHLLGIYSKFHFDWKTPNKPSFSNIKIYSNQNDI